jgi:hypothetical protein
MNIVDPCYSKNNLGKSVSYFNSCRLKEALRMQNNKLNKIYKKASKQKNIDEFLIQKLFGVFKYTFECSGVLPPLQLKMP